jgi:hypothetical protein
LRNLFYFHLMSPLQKILRDPAFWTLLLLNLLFIIEFRNDPSQYTSIILLYWCQSVLIGVFNFLDMVTAKNLKADITVNGKPATPAQAKGCLPLFFLVHYGIFHGVYLIFLMMDLKLTDTNFSYLRLALAGVLLQQVIQFVQMKTKYAQTTRTLSSLIFIPYLRIVPMHLTILLPKFLSWTPALTFLILKTIFDVIGHLVTTKYYWTKEGRSQPEEGYI